MLIFGEYKQVIIKHPMIKLSQLIFLLMLIGCKIQHQTGVILNPSLLPNKEYETTVITENNQIIEYVGNKELINNLKSRGVDYPITSNSRSIIQSQLVTGAKDEKGNFSTKAIFKEASSELSGSIEKLEKKKDETSKLKGIIIYGWSNENLQMKVDSIVGTDDENFRSVLKQSMENMFNQTNYPDTLIHIGESFLLETPLKIPTGTGEYFDFIIKNNYKLDSIGHEVEVAYFSILQEYIMKTELTDNKISVTGKGEGKLHFDIKNKTNLLFETESIMNTGLKMAEVEVRTKGYSKSQTITRIK